MPRSEAVASGAGKWKRENPTGEGDASRSRLSRPCRAGEGLILTVYLGLRAARFTPGFHMAGFQPGNVQGPKARKVKAWAGGPGKPRQQTSPALQGRHNQPCPN